MIHIMIQIPMIYPRSPRVISAICLGAAPLHASPPWVALGWLPALQEFRGKLGRCGGRFAISWDDGTEWLREDLQGQEPGLRPKKHPGLMD